MNRSTGLVSLLILGLMLAACAAGEGPSSSQPASPSTAPVGDPSASADAAAETPPSAAPSATAQVEADALLALGLTDVRTGESFTLGELAAESGPVLLEPMAVWCTSCRAQQHEVVRAHASGDFSSVSLDVDLSESPEQLASFADQEGFDWHFAMADADLYRLLQERFGVAATNPPSTPLIVVEEDGTVRPLEFGRGVRGADDLLAEIGAG